MRFLVLCEPAQSKCTWTCHKRYFMQKLQGNCQRAPAGAPVSCGAAQSKMHLDMSQAPFYAEVFP